MKKERLVELAGVKLNESKESKIFSVLMGAAFERWYEGTFRDFVEGEEGAVSKDEIETDIREMFNRT